MKSPRVLYIYQSRKGHVGSHEHAFLGSTKDIAARKEYFEARKICCDYLTAPWKQKYLEALTGFGEGKLRDYTAIFLEWTFSPNAIEYINLVSPDTVVVVRSNNAELFHRWHLMRAERSFHSATIKPTRRIALENFKKDIHTGRRADYVLSVSQWEMNHYWRYITSGARVKYLPFYLAESYVNSQLQVEEKKPWCVNLTSSLPNAFVADASRNFVRLVRELSTDLPEWRFFSTGDPESLFLSDSCERIEWNGVIPSPFDLLNKSMAMVILSDLGFGFKTKILEAIIAKNYVLVPRRIYRRLPEEVRPYCITVNLRSATSFKRALIECTRPFPEGNPNDLLRDKAFRVLDSILLNGASSQ